MFSLSRCGKCCQIDRRDCNEIDSRHRLSVKLSYGGELSYGGDTSVGAPPAERAAPIAAAPAEGESK